MLISEYLAGRNSISVSTGNGVGGYEPVKKPREGDDAGSFAEKLRETIGSREVEFSSHAIKRLESRQIDIAGSTEAWSSRLRKAARKALSSWTAPRLS